MSRKAASAKTPRFLFSSAIIVFILLKNSMAFAQEYDARIDVTFIKTDSSETRYLSLINYSNQPIELHLERIHCEPEDKINILTIEDSSISLGAYGPRDFVYLQNYSCVGFSEYSKLVIEPFSTLITPINERENNHKNDVYFALVVPKTTSISLNNKKKEYGFSFNHVLQFQRKYFIFFTKPATYAKLHIFPFEVNVNSTLTAKSGFRKDINKTTVIGLREYLSYFCE